MSFGQLLDGIHDLLGGLLDHLPSADGAVRDADTREKQAQVIIDLGDRANR